MHYKTIMLSWASQVQNRSAYLVQVVCTALHALQLTVKFFSRCAKYAASQPTINGLQVLILLEQDNVYL